MILEILILITAIPTGLLISHYTQDELQQGKPWFKAIILLSAIATLALIIKKQIPEALTTAFILITTLTSHAYKKPLS